jgi:hypothetical protein
LSACFWHLLEYRGNSTCLAACNGYQEDAIASWDNDTAGVVEAAFGAKEEDVCWATLVLNEHFTYHSSVLAGMMTQD